MRISLVSCVPLALLAAACADLTTPSSDSAGTRGTPAPGAEAPTLPAQAEPSEVAASHVLIAYQGATRATATRTKEEAQKLAQEVVTKARAGEDFRGLVGQFSDEPGAKERGGDLGKFTRERMVKPFSDAAFKLQVGQISDVVETQFGFHIIKRTQ